MSENLENNSRDIYEDPEGMRLYEYIVNNVESCADEMDSLIFRLKQADASGQYLASTARFLAAIDREKFAGAIPLLIEGAIERDRERRYIGQLLEAIWGKDYMDNAERLRDEDDLFRRLYKRVYPTGIFN